MKGRKILGIMVVMAMVLTAIPVMAGNAKASSDDSGVPNYLVIVRDIPEPHYVKTINKMIGNAYQDDKFGVEVIVRVQDYAYYPNGPDEVHLSITGIGVKGDNAGDYRVEWFEIGSTKLSFEGMKSDITPHATDYTSSIEATAQPYVGVGLRGHVYHEEVQWFKEIAGFVAGTATSLAVDAGTGGSAGPLSGLAGEGASYLVQNAIDSMFNVDQKGRNYRGSDTNPWDRSAEYPHTFTALRGVTDGSQDDPHKVLLARNLQWNLYDGINDRIHVLTLKATLCYAKYGFIGYQWTPVGLIPKYGWYDEHKISTSVTIYVAPQSMVGSVTRGTADIEIYHSDPANYEQYYLQIKTDTVDYHYLMPSNKSYTDSGDSGGTIFLMAGSYYNANVSEKYFYYRGALPVGDKWDKYWMGFAKDDEYKDNIAYIWIHASGDIKLTIQYDGKIYTTIVRGGHSYTFHKDIKHSEKAYITIEKLGTGSVSYWISGYSYHYDHISDDSSGDSGSGSSGGTGGSSGGAGSGGGGGSGGPLPPGPIPRSDPRWGHESDTALNSLP